jgi:hypothetical protein
MHPHLPRRPTRWHGICTSSRVTRRFPGGQEGLGHCPPCVGWRDTAAGVSSRTPVRSVLPGRKPYNHCDTKRKRSCSSSPQQGPWMPISLPITQGLSPGYPTRLVVPCRGAAGVTSSWGPSRVRTPSAARRMVTARGICAHGAATRPEERAIRSPRAVIHRRQTGLAKHFPGKFTLDNPANCSDNRRKPTRRLRRCDPSHLGERS